MSGCSPLPNPEAFCPRALALALKHDFSLGPVLACEVEFYLHGTAGLPGGKEGVLATLREALLAVQLPVAQVSAEVGPEQYEVALRPERDVEQALENGRLLYQCVAEVFAPLGVKADFSAKPRPDAPGNGVHVHLHLEDGQGRNQFMRAGDTMDAPFSPPLLHALGGMLALMNPCMVYFAPSTASYARFGGKSNAPGTVSWGTNNRTVALRLPPKALDNKHVEHRVAGSDAALEDVYGAVLAGVYYGLAHQCDAGEPIYGDANLPMYQCAALARTLEEAQGHYAHAEALLRELRAIC